MNTGKMKYEKPVVLDLGITEGMGDCYNGTLIVYPRCRTGSSPDMNSSCSKGSAALLGCSMGSVPEDCLDGSVASMK